MDIKSKIGSQWHTLSNVGIFLSVYTERNMYERSNEELNELTKASHCKAVLMRSGLKSTGNKVEVITPLEKTTPTPENM